MDLYTRNVLVGIFAIVVIGTVAIGEMTDVDTVKSLLEKISLAVTLATICVGCIYLRATKKRKKRTQVSNFSEIYDSPAIKAKK